jgi:tetrahydromethanopterin S-methyltransferase subunit G
MRWFERRKALEEDRPVGERLDAVADRLERVTDELEQKLKEMRVARDRDQEGAN